MKVTVRFVGLPILVEQLGKRIDFEPAGESIDELTKGLVAHYGSTVGNVILDKQGRLDPSIQVVINDEQFVRPKDHGNPILKDGDSVALMMLLPGG